MNVIEGLRESPRLLYIVNLECHIERNAIELSTTLVSGLNRVELTMLIEWVKGQHQGPQIEIG